uniref:Ovule protein n=1 Tax=Hymenolepis diminuta TaxID=6216 RepID=A0A0R3SZS1_HYMDI
LHVTSLITSLPPSLPSSLKLQVAMPPLVAQWICWRIEGCLKASFSPLERSTGSL